MEKKDKTLSEESKEKKEKEKKEEKEKKKEKKGNKPPTEFIAYFITCSVVGITVLMAAYLLVFTDKKEGMDYIGKSLLPLWGTWLGTVLAYYFGKANFQAGSKSYVEANEKNALEENISKIPVKYSMVPIKDLVYLKYEEDKAKTIKEILEDPEFKRYNRFAVLDDNHVVKYMIHRSAFLQFIYSKINGKSVDVEKPTLNEMIEKPTLNEMIEKLTLNDMIQEVDIEIKKTLNLGYGFVSISSTLLDAKKVIDKTEECLNVFITETGNSSEPVLGLITNNKIFERAKV